MQNSNTNNNNNQYQKIIFQYNSKQTQSICQYKFPLQILNFNIEILNNNHNEPYSIPNQIVDTKYPFDVMRQFLQAHQYQPSTFKLIKPINSDDYQALVDPQTYSVCSRFSLLQNKQKATTVVNLCRFLRFHQLQDAIYAAIATNYYIPANNQQSVEQFKRKHKIKDFSTDKITQIIREYQQVFNIIQTKAKEQFLKNYQQQQEQQDGENYITENA